jgi:HSP20 family molecular chaperone IbpA
MESQQVTMVPVQKAESIWDGIQEMYERITQRAHEIYMGRGGVYPLDLEDWLAAERELLWKPDAHVEEKDHRIVVTVRLGTIPPREVHLLVSPQAMLVTADPTPTAKCAFRTVEFPRQIDIRKVEATYADGCLTLTA